MGHVEGWITGLVNAAHDIYFELLLWWGLLYLFTAVCVFYVIRQLIRNRLRLLPASYPWIQVLGLNAFMLALLSIVAKPDAQPGRKISAELPGDELEIVMLGQTVLLCAVIGAFMPSIAASHELSNMFTNVRGVAVLVISAMLNILLALFYRPAECSSPCTSDPHDASPSIVSLKLPHRLVLAILTSLLGVLVVQAMAIKAVMEDVKAIVSQQLAQLYWHKKSGYNKTGTMPVQEDYWGWEVVEHNTCIKLMMVLTGRPENVVSRSPSLAIVGVLVVFSSINFFFMPPSILHLWVHEHPYKDSIGFVLYCPPILVCVLITVWRWVRVSLREDNPAFMSLLMDAEPSYWRRDVNSFCCKLRAAPREPPTAAAGIWRLYHVFMFLCFYVKVVLRDTMFLCFVAIHYVLVFIIRFTHILSILLIQRLLRPPLKALSCCICILIKLWPSKKRSREVELPIDFTHANQTLGVVCLDGEHVQNVRHEFAGVAHQIIRSAQRKREKTKSDLKDLLILLGPGSPNPASDKDILEILDSKGAPHIQNLPIEHGYQYGWYLTAISLLVVMTKIEKEVLGESTMSRKAMNAIWQARKMVKVVEAHYQSCIVCSTETFASACEAEWSKYNSELRHSCRLMLPARISSCSAKGKKLPEGSANLERVAQILEELLKHTETVIEKFNKKAKPPSNDGNVYVNVLWPKEVVVVNTKHTICRNLLISWCRTTRNVEEGRSIEDMLQHMNGLVAKILASCLSNLPAALDKSMTEAVHNNSVSKIKKGLFLIGHGKHLWTELGWPTLLGPPQNTSLGQLISQNHSSTETVLE